MALGGSRAPQPGFPDKGEGGDFCCVWVDWDGYGPSAGTVVWGNGGELDRLWMAEHDWPIGTVSGLGGDVDRGGEGEAPAGLRTLPDSRRPAAYLRRMSAEAVAGLQACARQVSGRLIPSDTVIMVSRDDLEAGELARRHHPPCRSYRANQAFYACGQIAQWMLCTVQQHLLPAAARLTAAGPLLRACSVERVTRGDRASLSLPRLPLSIRPRTAPATSCRTPANLSLSPCLRPIPTCTALEPTSPKPYAPPCKVIQEARGVFHPLRNRLQSGLSRREKP